MARWAYMMMVFVVLAAWASAQNPVTAPPQLSAEDQLRLLKANSALIDNLVNDGVAISSADTEVKRVEQCRQASRSLVNAIQQAADADDVDRFAVLTGLFREFVRDGLVPILQEAKRNIDPKSPDGERLRELSKVATNDLNDLKNAASATNKLNDSPSVKEALKGLDSIIEALK